MKRFVLYIVIILTAFSCSTDVLEQSGNEIGPVSFASTKGIGSQNTFRFYLNGIEGTTTAGIETSGTYIDQTSSSPLSPCAVDNNGLFTNLDDSKGLRSINGPYKMHIVSPAIEMVEIPDHIDMNGYFFNRNLKAHETPISISNTVDVSLTGVYLDLLNGGDGQYIFNASSQVLKQPRSKIKIKFVCGDKTIKTTLQKITLANIIPKGYYRPLESRFYFNNTIDTIIYNTPLTLPKIVDGSSIREWNLGIDEHILSMDYSATNSDGSYKWPLPSFVIEIGEDAEEVVTFTAALAYNFEFQYEYEFTIIINTMYVNITVEAMPWDNGGEHSSVVDKPKKWNISFPLKDGENVLLDWDKIDGITGTIQ